MNGETFWRWCWDGDGLEQPVAAKGEVVCVGGHEDWWLGDRPCPWCKAVK